MNMEERAAAMYASQQPKPAAPPAAEATAAAPAAAPAPAVAPPAEAKPPADPQETAADRIYGGSAPTRTAVNWDEPPAAPGEFDLTAPVGMLDTSPEGIATLNRLREGLAEAGAGRTLAAELFQDAVRFHQGATFAVPRASGEADLRKAFGALYDTKVAAAQGVVAQVAKRCPEIYGFLDRTGLGNDPAFIQKLAAAAARRRR